MATTSGLDVTNTHVYSQRMLPAATALVALFHAQPAPHHEHANLRRKPLPTTSCLRKISAYNGGFPVVQDDDEAALMDSSFELAMGCGVAPYAKKRLSFADQHGGQLVLEREFHARDAPIYCNKAITHMIPSSVSTGHGDASGRQVGSRSMVMERLLRAPGSSKQRGGRGGEEQKSGWSQPELLSLCVLSCSVVGYVMLNYARTLQST